MATTGITTTSGRSTTSKTQSYKLKQFGEDNGGHRSNHDDQRTKDGKQDADAIAQSYESEQFGEDIGDHDQNHDEQQSKYDKQNEDVTAQSY